MGEESDRRRAILDAAFEEFASKGFRGATIKGIARAARLQSPALLYWYFPQGKEELLQRVLERHAPIIQAVLDPDALLERPPEEVLDHLGRTYLATVQRPAVQRLVRLIAQEALRRPEVADAIGGRLLTRVLDFLKVYLAHQIALGRLRPHDVRASARAFMGMLVPQALTHVAFPCPGRSVRPGPDPGCADRVRRFTRSSIPRAAGRSLEECGFWVTHPTLR